ncbi:VOC family protein [Janthinobacterium sp. PSPC1-1]|jgi:predicted enzyme related to lactoylglutathione lyase|uniref:VOC family protein n=1 Tax=Janthinobacterium sp. PSPC1-1 TaxID=2804581 RepID=UPI003CF1BD90
MPILNAIASLAVRDLTASSAWYASLLDKEADTRPMPEVAEWKFDRGGGLQLYQQPERAGGGSVTLAVDDIDLLATHLQQLNVAHGALTRTAQVRTIMLTDPDGNHIAFAQVLGHAMAR